jgi:NADPH-dependent 2,4-dienoyl-CoA reductase/sulfur reductase-like enzyme
VVDRLVVIGGDAAGMSAAAQARRRRADLEIVALERTGCISYSACGIPWAVSGELAQLDVLVARRPEDFRSVGIDVRLHHEAVAIDLERRRVEVHDRLHRRTFQLGFDLLHLATGAVAHRPALPGLDSPHVHGIQTLDDAARLLDDVSCRSPHDVVVIGSGYVGLELAEAFCRRGASVTVVERAAEVMPSLDPDLGAKVNQAMRSVGIRVRVGESLTAVEGPTVRTTDGSLNADLVVLGLGVEPNTSMAAASGLATGVRDALVVDRRQRTSVNGVWAAGDCCQSVHIVSGQPFYEALGTVANKQGRVAGINIGGGYATFPGVAGTAVTRVGDLEIGRSGLTEAEAETAGFCCVVASVDTTTEAGYMPGARPMTVKLVAEQGGGRILGVQIVGGPGSAKRVDVAATALSAQLTVEDLLGLDLGYAPPYSSVWDPLQTAARRTVSLLR